MEGYAKELARELWGEGIENLSGEQKALLSHNLSLYATQYRFATAERVGEYLSEDLKNIEELKSASLNYGKPKVGDWVEIGGDLRRIAYIWDREDGIIDFQPADGGSFCMSRSGNASMSGSLDSSLEGELTDSGETREGWCWYWHRSQVGAGMGLNFKLPFRVWKFREASREKVA